MPSNERFNYDEARNLVDQVSDANARVARSRRRSRVSAALAVVSVAAYPTILAFTNQLLPTGDFKTDVAKYSLEFILGASATAAVAAARKQRRVVESNASDVAQINRKIDDMWSRGNWVDSDKD